MMVFYLLSPMPKNHNTYYQKYCIPIDFCLLNSNPLSNLLKSYGKLLKAAIFRENGQFSPHLSYKTTFARLGSMAPFFLNHLSP